MLALFLHRLDQYLAFPLVLLQRSRFAQMRGKTTHTLRSDPAVRYPQPDRALRGWFVPTGNRVGRIRAASEDENQNERGEMAAGHRVGFNDGGNVAKRSTELNRTRRSRPHQSVTPACRPHQAR